jgi:cell division protein FtsB
VNAAQGLTVLLVAAIIAVGASIAVGSRSIGELRALRAQRQRLGEQTVALLRETQALRAESERLRTDDLYLERLARLRLGLVRENEIVYRFRGAPAPQAP